MAYKEHQWDKGELITSEKLNHMEMGIAGAMGKRESDTRYSNALIGQATGSGQATAEDAAASLANLIIAGKSEQAKTTGAQLLDMSAASSGSSNGITAVVNSDGTYVSNGVSTNIDTNIWLLGGWNIPPKADNTNVILTLEQGKTYAISDVILLSVVNGKPKSTSGIYVCNDSGGFKVTGIRHPGTPVGTKLTNKKYYPMVNVGTTAKPWEPYTGVQPSPSPEYPQPIVSTGDSGTVTVTVTGGAQPQAVSIPLTTPLRGLGEYQDRIICKDGEWGIERSVVKLTFDGSSDEVWLIGNEILNSGNYFAAYTRLKDRKLENILCYCNQYKPMYTITQNEITGGVAVSEFCRIEPTTTAMYISVNKARLDTPDIAGLRTWLGENSVSIEYALTIPTWEPLPAITQAALNALSTHVGVGTSFKVTTDGPAADVMVEYVRDINEVIDYLQRQINALKGGKTS